MNNITSTLSKLTFMVQKKSPELLMVGSIIAAAGSIILAIKATPKAEEVVEKANNDISEIKENMNDDNKIANNEYSISAGKKDLTKAYTKTAAKLAKVYLPTIIGFTLTAAGILESHKIIKGRGVALAAAYTTLENGYKSYRERVANKIGDSAEKDIFRNVYAEDKETTTTDKDGKEVTEIKKVNCAHSDINSDFTVMYDRRASEWQRDTNMVLNILAMKQKYLTEVLKFRGALFLHEVYDELGIDISILGEEQNQASRILGWIYDPDDNTRDNYISFGLFDQLGNKNKYAMDSLRNNAQELFLEFNVDGDILTGNNGNKKFTGYRRVL